MSPSKRRAAAASAALLAAAGCALRRDAFLVPSADVEHARAADACVEVMRRLGEEKARALLAGHVVRRGDRLVLVVREWDGSARLPARRVTASIEPAARIELELPSEGVSLRADRASADGAEVADLRVASGRLRVGRTEPAGRRVEMELRFAEPDEPPLRIDGFLLERGLDGLGPSEGRADRMAPPEKFVR